MLYLKAREGVENLTEWKGRKGKFVKVFLINDQRNKNGWRVTWDSILHDTHDFVQKPGIEYVKCEADGCDLDHTDGTTYENNLTIQERYRVSTIVDFVIDEPHHTAYAIHEIIDDAFAEKLAKGEVRYVSPSIWPKQGQYEVMGRDGEGRLIIDVYGWRAIHSAWVNKPAFGDDAKVIAQCQGQGKDCHLKLLTATEADPLDPLKEVPLLLKHNGNHVFVSTSECVQKIIQQKIDDGIKITEQELAIAYSECGQSKKASCTCSKAKLESLATKLQAVEEKITLHHVTNKIKLLQNKIDRL